VTPAELTQAREALGLSQVELAQQLGVHPTMVNRWERGRAKMAPYLHLALERLADTLVKHKSS
jgi:ribosome-binding protein aMBF1 (putative translation factor)